MPQGWINNDTFRVYGTGYSKNTSFNAVQRHNSACKAAELEAQANVIIKLAGITSHSVSGKYSIEETKNKIITRFSGTIRGGQIVQQVYNKNDGKCTVVYQIKEKNLKIKFKKYVRSIR